MSRNKFHFPDRAWLALGAGLVLALAGCVDGSSSGSVYADTSAQFVGDDDYVYYPDYEMYYSSRRHEYVYLDGRSWVRRPSPRGVTADVLLSSRSVRLDFHDSPERHNAEVVRQYPRHWTPTPGRPAPAGGSDNYVYYPNHEVYYNTTQRQYVYQDGKNWVTRPQPPKNAAKALPSAPSVAVPFHDAPQQHHADTVKTYPKNWKPQPPPNRPAPKDDHRDDRKDDHKDDHRDGDKRNQN